MGLNLSSIIGGNVASFVKDAIGAFKLDPAKKAEYQAAVDENAALLAQKQLEIEGKLQDAISTEIQSAADIIKAEAGSQSWLPRNVRPFLLLVWGLTIAANALLPLIARVTGRAIEPVVLDSWLYQLTAIGFTGYVTARSFDKYVEKRSQLPPTRKVN